MFELSNVVIALLFSGQGFQRSVRTQDINWHPKGQEVIRKGDEFMNAKGLHSFTRCVSDKSYAYLLSQTLYAQLVMYIAAMAKLEIFKEKCPEIFARCKLALGHSAAEIAALVSMGFFSFEQGLQVVWARAYPMEQIRGGATTQIMGKDVTLKSANKLCEDVLLGMRLDRMVLAPSIYQRKGMINVGGHVEAVKRLEEVVRGVRGLKASRFDMAYPFHVGLMAGAAQEFADGMATVQFAGSSNGSVISNYRDPENPKRLQRYTPTNARFLAERQVWHMVDWVGCCQAAAERSDLCIHIGPGRIDALARNNAPNWTILRCGSKKELRALQEMFA